MIWGATSKDETVRLCTLRTETGEDVGVSLPGGGDDRPGVQGEGETFPVQHQTGGGRQHRGKISRPLLRFEKIQQLK